MSRRAVILAGGQGTRLRPYTSVLPKPLMPIGDKPILEIIILQLARQQFDHVTLAVNYHANVIKAFFGDGERWGIKIDYSLETKPLSTIAPLSLIPDLPPDFLLLNGDVLTDLNFRALCDGHCADSRLFTIAATERTHRVDYGVLEVNQRDLLQGFREKPTSQYLVSMGVYVVNREVLEVIPDDLPYGFDDLMYNFLEHGKEVHIHRHKGYWLDIGRPDDYMKALDEFEQKRGDLFGRD